MGRERVAQPPKVCIDGRLQEAGQGERGARRLLGALSGQFGDKEAPLPWVCGG